VILRQELRLRNGTADRTAVVYNRRIRRAITRGLEQHSRQTTALSEREATDLEARDDTGDRFSSQGETRENM